ncbi:MAG TPA: 3-hydroxyisobutyrate dehydrogenase [Alphaproteobacteria bacterium]|nr:3-hydroxyisobutyrate dehydrogenase [Alphaproteobacteria bacterium]HIM72800.1 3-hydroxyisobutyrate dehydrogenase [Alphaproteobacteria bacterium]
MTIGFIGTGNMGYPMVRNLVKAGNKVTAFDRLQSALQSAAAAGGAMASSQKEVVMDAEIVITMLPAGQHVRTVYGSDDGVIATASNGTLLIDCSTIDVESARAVAKEAAARGLDMLDAPVSGGVAGAEEGTLTFMVGGSAEVLERARPVLEAMGKNIVHAGDSGSGQAAKLCNNMMLGISMIGTSEAFTMGQKLGLNPQTLFDIISTASGSCWALQNHLPIPGIVETSASNRGFRAGFAVAMMAKDLRLAQLAAKSVDASTPLGSTAAALYTSFEDSGNQDLDYSAIIKLIAAQT